MNAPFFKYGAFGGEASLIVAFAIGIAFGFFLERAGFGSARKLVSQFYLNDLAVFKVMFSAIVTAMLGIFYLGWVGILDLSLLYLPATRIWPQLTGGLALGIGFVIGGYCPGTSMVALATGRLDALAYVAGVVAGAFLIAEATPWVLPFHESGNLGRLTLPEVLHLPYGAVVLLVVVVALAGFAGAEWVERRVGGRPGQERP